MPRLFAIAITAVWTLAPPVQAQPRPAATERPAALNRLMDCRAISEVGSRLACFDREAAALDAAVAGDEVIVLDQEQVRKTRRSIFGLTLPDLAIFGGSAEGAQDSEGVTQLDSTVRTASQNGLGKWILQVEDGARWIQTDSRELARDPKPGQPIAIRRAAMGSYLANIDGQIAIRVRRIN